MSTATQTNTRQGDLPFPSLDNLSAKGGCLVKPVNDSGVAKVALPDAVTDRVLYVVVDGKDAAGDNAEVRPLTPDRNLRVRLHGTCNPGDAMTLAAIDATHDGQARALPATAGSYFVFGYAEEAGIDGQLVLVRPHPTGLVTVS